MPRTCEWVFSNKHPVKRKWYFLGHNTHQTYWGKESQNQIKYLFLDPQQRQMMEYIMMFLNQRLNSIVGFLCSWRSQEAIMVIRLDHPQCPKLGWLWMQAEPSESQGRITSKHRFIKRPFIDVKCKLHNKLNFIQFWDIGPETRNHQLNAKTTLCAQIPPPPSPLIARTSAGSGENLFLHSINSSTLQMGILLLDKYLRCQYGNTGYGVSSPGIQNIKVFA